MITPPLSPSPSSMPLSSWSPLSTPSPSPPPLQKPPFFSLPLLFDCCLFPTPSLSPSAEVVIRKARIQRQDQIRHQTSGDHGRTGGLVSVSVGVMLAERGSIEGGLRYERVGVRIVVVIDHAAGIIAWVERGRGGERQRPPPPPLDGLTRRLLRRHRVYDAKHMTLYC